MGPAPAPLADAYSDRPDIRVLQLLDSMNGLWERTFAAAGDDYERPTVETRGGERGKGCGSDVGAWNCGEPDGGGAYPSDMAPG